MYDLAGKNDWRKNMNSSQIKGPIDHVSKNKEAFKKESRMNTVRASGGSYIKKGKQQLASQRSE